MPCTIFTVTIHPNSFWECGISLNMGPHKTTCQILHLYQLWLLFLCKKHTRQSLAWFLDYHENLRSQTYSQFCCTLHLALCQSQLPSFHLFLFLWCKKLFIINTITVTIIFNICCHKFPYLIVFRYLILCSFSQHSVQMNNFCYLCLPRLLLPAAKPVFHTQKYMPPMRWATEVLLGY
jgi:hypothetical protein